MYAKRIFQLIVLTLILTSCQNMDIDKKIKKESSIVSDEKTDREKLNKRLVETNKIWDSLNEHLNDKGITKVQEDSLRRLFIENKENQESIFKKFIIENPNSLVSIETLNGFKFSWGKALTEKLFNKLSQNIRSTDKGKLVQNYIKYYRDPEISDKYSDFELPDSNGNLIRISENLSDYTLLEFWASWCSGCRKEHPELVQVYKRFNDSKFTILGISSDSNKEDWQNAVEKDNLPWKNLRDSLGRESIVQYQYGIHAIPTNFLIGPDQKIIAKDIKPMDLEILLEKILSETAHNNGSSPISGSVERK